jgi:hypothetical protein
MAGENTHHYVNNNPRTGHRPHLMPAAEIRLAFIGVGWVGKLRQTKPYAKKSLLFERCSDNTGAA